MKLSRDRDSPKFSQTTTTRIRIGRPMSFFSRIADAVVLSPSVDFIDAEDRAREVVERNGLSFEMWGKYWPATGRPEHEIAILKFPGTGGRAERAGPHPIDSWPDVAANVWAVNPPGYGTSGGRATVGVMPMVAEAAWEFIRSRHPNVPILVAGNSLGCVSAMYVVARYPATGLLIRNPPPIHQIIATRARYNWWNFGAARWVAAEIPRELDAVENAKRTNCPAFFVQSVQDRLVPTTYQEMIIDAYAGEKNVFQIPGADHHDLIPETDQTKYAIELEWLRKRLLAIK